MSKYKPDDSRFVSRLRDIESAAAELAQLDLEPTLTAKRIIYVERLDMLERSQSGSWFGDHASVYYEDFQAPPSGRTFNVEWGFVGYRENAKNRSWRLYSRAEIMEFVFEGIGEEIFHALGALEKEISAQFSVIHGQTLDLVELLAGMLPDTVLSRHKVAISDKNKPCGFGDYINSKLKSAPHTSRDSSEMIKGQIAPAHVQYRSIIWSIDTNKRRLLTFTENIRSLIEVLNMSTHVSNADNSHPKIFIGHGRSREWLILKDFLKEKLGLDHEEFNRVSTAGIGTKERLSEMLDNCNFGFLVMTAEDAHADDTLHARENVVHEIGLFQGRYGWRKAIVLIEEGCKEFSNIVGLGQIRFPKGNLGVAFEEIRDVLMRESVISD
jgi:Predicted nucleotide-binding protein containing TIR-like domain